MSLEEELHSLAERSLAASRSLAIATSRRKNIALLNMAANLEMQKLLILAANAKDVAAARRNEKNDAFIDRLTLDDARFDAMVQGVRDIAELPDPVGTRLSRIRRPNGLVITKRRVPIGVILIIYEARPNVTVDAAALCIKTGNAVILRGGKESFNTNVAIARALADGASDAGLPPECAQYVETTDRDAVKELVRMEGLIDVVIPRGGESLIRAVVDDARIPVLKHYKGVCSIFVDASADFEMALNIFENAKCQRPAVCNAVETILVHEAVAREFVPRFALRCKALGVSVHADEIANTIVPGFLDADESSWSTEYLDRICNLKIVPDVESAIEHINHYGSHHSDAIITRDANSSRVFARSVDSATVYVNASTRFTDGGQFGMGAEMGISTDKLHARGPMGLVELTTYKYIIKGSGQVRE